MSILFINGSPNKNGNTVRFTKKFLKESKNLKQLNLVDYKILQLLSKSILKDVN